MQIKLHLPLDELKRLERMEIITATRQPVSNLTISLLVAVLAVSPAKQAEWPRAETVATA